MLGVKKKNVKDGLRTENLTLLMILFFFNLSFFETRLCCVFQGGFKLEILLPYRRVNTENS